ncbi:MAG: hypothetical protein M3Y58_00500 [Chloroflexota bacterium]|nr:hypothetical protein [Chloroflexota bacterium]
MNEMTRSRLALAAYGVAALFAIRLPSFYFLPQSSGSLIVRELSALLGIAPHLLLFVVVAALPAPSWARSAGYGWLAIDMTTDIMALNGVAPATFLPLRYGGHIAAALWIATASWQAKGATRNVGLLLALDLAGYSFIAPFVSFVALLPSIVLLPAWFVLVARHIGHEAEAVQESADRSSTVRHARTTANAIIR